MPFTIPWHGHRNMEQIHLTLDSTLQSVDQAESVVVDEAEKLGFGEDERHEIGMAVRECMVNAVVHGNRYNKRKHVDLNVQRTEAALAITIGDEGEGFDPDALPDPTSPENLLRQSGRGILLIRAFMDEFEFHPRPGGGTEVRLVKNVPKS